MTETLESLLNLLCKSVSTGQHNAQQTLYLLGDAKDARLAYDVLVACGLDVKYFADADESGGKLYVQNASLAASADKIAESLASAPLLKQIKNLVDARPDIGNYSLSFASTPTGRQLTLLLPADKNIAPVVIAPKPSASAAAAPARPGVRPRAVKKAEDSVLGGPTVARKAIPKSFKTSDTDEDPLSKRILFYLSSRAFTSTAWLLFLMLILGVVFSIIVTVRGFMCPDVATDKRSIPAYCPQQMAPKEQ